MKRSYVSQEPTDIFEMPSTPRRQKPRRSINKRKNLRSIPRALVTRGTPNGYYEIPVTIYRKLYYNMSTGMWPTNQTTGAQTGLTGYQGFALGTDLSTSKMWLGNGAFSDSINVTIPGFTHVQAVFDECKIHKIEYELWFQNQGADPALGSSTLMQSSNMFVVEDANNLDPPSSLGTILQYSKVHRVIGDLTRPKKITLYPKIRLDAGSASDEMGTTTTLGVTAPSTYVQTTKPAVEHFGLRGWFDTCSVLNGQFGYIGIKETQYRRYKRII